jgi:hypothetical protein
MVGFTYAAIALTSACESDILLGSRYSSDDLDASGGRHSDAPIVVDSGFTGDPCTDYSNFLCELEQGCNLLFFRNLLWGDLAVCKERRKLRCLARLAAHDSNDTAARMASCANTIARFSCEDYGNADAWPETCGTPAGNLADGASCGIGAQCRGRACFPPDGSACGSCSTLPGLGSPCTGICDDFLQCWNGTCVAFGKLGESCRYGGPLCGYGLACIGAASGQGKCLTNLKLGATCDPTALECDDAQGLVCDATTNLCRVDQGLPGPGQPCFGNQYCRADAWCNLLINRCQPKRREGESCGTSIGTPQCLQPAICVSNACALPNGNVCP